MSASRQMAMTMLMMRLVRSMSMVQDRLDDDDVLADQNSSCSCTFLPCVVFF